MRIRGALGSFETSKNSEVVLSNWGVELIQIVVP
jgi:hypothetical protein